MRKALFVFSEQSLFFTRRSLGDKIQQKQQGHPGNPGHAGHPKRKRAYRQGYTGKATRKIDYRQSAKACDNASQRPAYRVTGAHNQLKYYQQDQNDARV